MNIGYIILNIIALLPNYIVKVRIGDNKPMR